jgi:DNA-binding transcriptional ArsR family regulator
MLGPMDDAPPRRRPPTAAEARALAHPTRLRIVFACRDRALTNKELAQQLGTTPGTIHYHLRPLVEEGFLRAEEPRPGPRGSKEQPYRSTGKSWEVGGSVDTGSALREVGAQEVLAARDEDVVELARLGIRLSEDELASLLDRFATLLEDARARHRPDDPAARPVTVFLAVHQQPS